MLDTEVQDGVERPAGVFFDLRERVPGPGQQFISPAFQEIAIELIRKGGSGGLADVGMKRLGQRLPSSMVVHDYVGKNPFDEVPKSAATRVSPEPIAAQTTQLEFLGHLLV